jgi:hypothetical protein
MSRNRRRHKLRRKSGLQAAQVAPLTPTAAAGSSSVSAPSASVSNDRSND